MKLVLSRQATRRLHEIADYIHERNPSAARRVQRGIRDALALLLTYPEAGRAIEPGVRRFAVPRLPYLIYDRFDEVAGTLQIVPIHHAAMQEES